MSVRLVEIFLPDAEVVRLEEILPHHCRRFWRETVPGGQEKYSCLVQQRYAERLFAGAVFLMQIRPTFREQLLLRFRAPRG